MTFEFFSEMFVKSSIELAKFLHASPTKGVNLKDTTLSGAENRYRV